MKTDKGKRSVIIVTEKREWPLQIDATFIDYFIRIMTKPHGLWRKYCKMPPKSALEMAVFSALGAFLDELERPEGSEDLV